MRKPATDWKKEMELFRSSSLTLPEFCKKRRINHHTFRYHLYSKSKKKESHSNFELMWQQEEFRISFDQTGHINIHGLNPEKFLSFLQSQNHALS